ncbi:hypothetical protein BLA60_24510 [Actinophytocola xinjiangensis]|uniref:AAA domain-containing protein n=1 Tax=Actinophytocola xinjiangensis TaxID=485602 RepID=A0A7Z0WIH1_9PSEU|nr:AAA family ATPase [Actinophytocola xinjiangensis]OLF08037.1 hypothetical protein BLA60_24510 [Actinophytocola xinjiangensis]
MVARAVVVAVCGSPGAGKTTVARAVAGRLGVPCLTRDEVKVGLGLSGATIGAGRQLRFAEEFFVAGGAVSERAEEVMVEAAGVLAAGGVSFVVESSVVSERLVGVLVGAGARVLAVWVVARDAVIGERLRGRAAGGGAVDRQLAEASRRGELRESVFEPAAGVTAVVRVDTSDRSSPDVVAVVSAFGDLVGED